MSSVNNAVSKANAKPASNILNNVNGLFCKGYPFRYYFALFIFCLNVLVVLSGVFYFSHPLMILFNLLFALLWYFVGWKRCYPISIFMLSLFIHILSLFMYILFIQYKAAQ